MYGTEACTGVIVMAIRAVSACRILSSSYSHMITFVISVILYCNQMIDLNVYRNAPCLGVTSCLF